MNGLPARLRAVATAPTLVSVGLALVSTLLLSWQLGRPGEIIFDEVYYVNDAREYLEVPGVEASFAVHPPLGKWFIAAGIALLGDRPVGWRAAGVVVGVVTVVVVHRLARRLLSGLAGREWWAALAAGLLALDGLFLVQSRTAMLDIFLGGAVVVAVYAVVRDRDERDLLGDAPRSAGLGEGSWWRAGRWRVLAGVAFGAAIAVKWSGLLALGGAGLLVLGWELGARRRATGRWWHGAGWAVPEIGATLIVVPAVVYLLSWAPWVVNYPQTSTAGDRCEGVEQCEVALDERLQGLVRHHDEILGFHAGLEATHSYRAPAVSWPVLGRPVVYEYETCSAERAAGGSTLDEETGEEVALEPCVVEQGQASEVIALGNPAVWWGFLAATPTLLAGVRRRDGRSSVPVVLWAAQVLPWLPVSRTLFLFYMTPVVPFVAVGLGVAIADLTVARRRIATHVGAVLGGALGFGLGFGGSVLVGATTWTPRWLALFAGWVVGALVGARIDDRDVVAAAAGTDDPAASDDAAPPAPDAALPARDDDPTSPDPGPHSPAAPGSSRMRPAAWLVGATAAVVTIALFVWFLPVWTGVPLPEELVRQRWWLDSWV